MAGLIESLGFEFPKFLWQLVNFTILLGFLFLVFLIPRWIFGKINSIDKNLKEINKKLDQQDGDNP